MVKADASSGGNRRIVSFSYMRALACAAIIVLHTVYSSVLLYGNSITAEQNIISQIVCNNMMWAVPCFVMVTGALLLDEKKTITIEKIGKNYIFRMLKVLVIFSIIFWIFDMVMNKETFSAAAFLNAFSEIFTGTGWSHMWYIYLLIGLYLLLPFYRMIASHGTEQEIKYLLVIYVVFLSVLPITQIWNLKSGFYIHVSTIYPFYLFCGYVMHKRMLKIGKVFSGILAAVATLGIALMTVLKWKYNLQTVDGLWSYSSILVVGQAVGIFTLIDQWQWNEKSILEKMLDKIDKCSFGIYLIHMMFVRLTLRYMGINLYEFGVLGFAAMVIGILLVSYALTWILKKIPVFKTIL